MSLLPRKNQHDHNYTEKVYIQIDGTWIELDRCPRRATGYDLGPQHFPCGVIAFPWIGELKTVACLPAGAVVVESGDLKYSGFSADYLRHMLKEKAAQK
jgi:hypothetical protein